MDGFPVGVRYRAPNGGANEKWDFSNSIGGQKFVEFYTEAALPEWTRVQTGSETYD